MKTKILIIGALLFGIFLPFFTSNASAYGGGLLEGKPLKFSSDGKFGDISVTNNLIITDNNTTTSHSMYRDGLGDTFANAVYYEFSQPITIDRIKWITGVSSISNSVHFNVRFYNSEKTLIKQLNGSNYTVVSSVGIDEKIIPVENVSYVEIYNANTGTNLQLAEFDVFSPLPPSPYAGGLLDGKSLNVGSDIKNTAETTTKLTDFNEATSYQLSWQHTTKDTIWYKFDTGATINSLRLKGDVTHLIFHYLDGSIKYIRTDGGTQTSATSFQKSDGSLLILSTPQTNVQYVSLNAYDGNPKIYSEFNVYGETQEIQPVQDIDGVLHTKDHESVTFNYTIPKSNNFSHIKIYRDGLLIKDNHTESTFKDSGLTPDTTYNYKFVSYGLDGSKTTGREVAVKTNKPPIMEDVTNLKANTKETSITLNYDFPENPDFSHVEIYRDGELIKDNHKESSYLDEGLQGETEHTYKVVSVSLKGVKSSGVSIKTETKPYNKEFTDLIKEEVDEDFVFTWSSPGSGQVKVFIAGKEYTTVSADQKRVSIPKSDMKYDIYDQPLVTLQAIAPDGKEGPISKPDNVNAGSPIERAKEVLFGVKDLLSAGMGILSAVGGFILLGMAFFFQDSLLGLVKTSFRFIRGWGGSE